MPLIDVEYSVPVFAKVNTDNGEVVSVTVFDEGAERVDAEQAITNGDPNNPGAIVTDPELRAKAIKIADQSDWPSWDLGY